MRDPRENKSTVKHLTDFSSASIVGVELPFTGNQSRNDGCSPKES